MRIRSLFLVVLGLWIACVVSAASAADAKPVLRFNAQGKFKIVQITDTHWNQDAEKCRKTLEVLNRVLDREKPDLVAMTGDIVTTGKGTPEGWQAITEPMRRRKIPWAAVLGNHDDEYCGIPRRAIVKQLAAMPYSLVEEGPASLGGTGNYIVTVAGRDSKTAAVLYFLDSHAYAEIDAVKRHKGLSRPYGWISFDQIQWYRESSRGLRKANGGQPLPALAMFHIPLQEYADASLLKTAVGTQPAVGKTVGGPLNTGMFAAMVEEGDVMGCFVGHVHSADYAGMLYGVCLAYGRSSGYAAVGPLPRGARVIELVEGRREFTSWIREGDGKEVHRFHYPTAPKGTAAPETKAEK
jgi:hypothetical protein